jgi:hypothetical protein
MLLTVGSIPRSTDDAFLQIQQIFPEPVVIYTGRHNIRTPNKPKPSTYNYVNNKQ